MCSCGRWWSEWQPYWASQANCSNHRWPFSTNLDISDMGSWATLMLRSCLCQPVFRVPPEPTLCFISLGANSCPPSREVDGCNPPNETILCPLYKMVIFDESRAFQSERACADHHICQLWIKQCLCCEHHHNCSGILQKETASCISLFVSTNHSGKL